MLTQFGWGLNLFAVLPHHPQYITLISQLRTIWNYVPYILYKLNKVCQGYCQGAPRTVPTQTAFVTELDYIM